ncbi:MAG: hypothetical protein Q9198_005585 [Flavoplaca austrocitrina]
MSVDQTSQKRRPSSFNLLQLPNELLLRVVHLTHSRDLDNLCLSSKYVYNLAEGSRKRHLDNKKRYRTVVLGDTFTASRHGLDRPAAIVHPAFLLRDLLRDKETISDYCEIIKIGGISHDGRVEDTDRYGQPTLDEARIIALDTIARMDDLIVEPLLNGCSKDEWRMDLADNMYDLPCMLSLVFLRNVRILEITRCYSFLEKIFEYGSGTWEMTVDVSSATLQPLGQLEEFRLYGDEEDGGQGLPPLLFLLKFPRLRKIYGKFVHHLDDFSHFEECWPMLQEIYFEYCCGIDIETMEQLLRGTGTLKTFYYHHFHNGRTEIELYNPCDFIMLLRKYASQTLATFTCILTGKGEDYDPDYRYDQMDVPSLQDFKALTHAAVDCSLFTADNMNSNHWDRQLDTGFFKEEDLSEGVPRFVDVLPPSLESLVLHRPRESNELPGLFRDLQQLRNERLPKLRSVIIRTNQAFEIYPTLKEECQQLGIKLEIETDLRTEDTASNS